MLVSYDYDKWLEVHCMKSTTSGATIEKLREIFADNGSNFTSSEFEEFMKRSGTKHINVVPHHLASNGLAERAGESLKKALRRWVRGAFKRSYLDSFSVIERPLTVRLERHLQSYG